MQSITPFLWFDNNLEEAMNFYVSVFGEQNTKIISVSRLGDKRAVFTATFELRGQKLMGLNGGPHFKFTEAISLFVSCETQDEVDYLWEKLSEGGQIQQCGWLKDKFGLSWQIVPTILGKLMGDKDPEKSKRVMNAMMQMKKIESSELQKAYDQQ